MSFNFFFHNDKLFLYRVDKVGRRRGRDMPPPPPPAQIDPGGPGAGGPGAGGHVDTRGGHSDARGHHGQHHSPVKGRVAI